MKVRGCYVMRNLENCYDAKLCKGVAADRFDKMASIYLLPNAIS